MSELDYLAGFGNQFQSEAVPGALPVGRTGRGEVRLHVEVLHGPSPQARATAACTRAASKRRQRAATCWSGRSR